MNGRTNEQECQNIKTSLGWKRISLHPGIFMFVDRSKAISRTVRPADLVTGGIFQKAGLPGYDTIFHPTAFFVFYLFSNGIPRFFIFLASASRSFSRPVSL